MSQFVNEIEFHKNERQNIMHLQISFQIFLNVSGHMVICLGGYGMLSCKHLWIDSIFNTGKENPKLPASMLVALLYLFMQACLHFCDTFLF